MNLQFHMQTQANASGDFLSFHGLSNPQSPISTLGFRSSALRQPLLPLLSHKSDAKRPIPLLRVRVVAEHSVDGNRSADSSPAKALRLILTSLGIQQCPACFDALSAKLVERAGFRCCFTSGIVPLTSFTTRFGFFWFDFFFFFLYLLSESANKWTVISFLIHIMIHIVSSILFLAFFGLIFSLCSVQV